MMMTWTRLMVARQEKSRQVQYISSNTNQRASGHKGRKYITSRFLVWADECRLVPSTRIGKLWEKPNFGRKVKFDRGLPELEMLMLTLRNKLPTKKGSWWLTGLKFTNRASQPLLNWGLTHVVFQGEACIGLCACTVFLLSEPTLIKKSWNYISINKTEAFPALSS